MEFLYSGRSVIENLLLGMTQMSMGKLGFAIGDLIGEP